MISENNKDKEGTSPKQKIKDKTKERFISKRLWKNASYEEINSSIYIILDNMKVGSINLLLIDYKIISSKDIWLALNDTYKFGKIEAFGFTKEKKKERYK